MMMLVRVFLPTRDRSEANLILKRMMDHDKGRKELAPDKLIGWLDFWILKRHELGWCDLDKLMATDNRPFSTIREGILWALP